MAPKITQMSTQYSLRVSELSNANDNGSVAKLDFLRNASMTIVLYAEAEIKTLRQMFVDASQNKRIEEHTVTRFDQRDAFNVTAVRLANDSHLFGGRVELERSSVAASSQYLLAINQLATALKILEVGYGRRVSRDRNDELMLDLDGLYERCRVWSDEFMPAGRKWPERLITSWGRLPSQGTLHHHRQFILITNSTSLVRLWPTNSWCHRCGDRPDADLRRLLNPLSRLPVRGH